MKERLAPHSREKHDVSKMLAEWYATLNFEDRGSADGECGICGHSDTRWEFTVRNRYTSKEIRDAGSICITRFPELAVMVAPGREINDRDEKHALLSRAIAERIRERNAEIAAETLEAIRDRIPEVPAASLPRAGIDLWTGACDRIGAALNGAGRGRSGSKVWPDTFKVFAWAGAATGVVVPMRAFQGMINLQGRGKDQMIKMRDEKLWLFELIRDALTPSQRSQVERWE